MKPSKHKKISNYLSLVNNLELKVKSLSIILPFIFISSYRTSFFRIKSTLSALVFRLRARLSTSELLDDMDSFSSELDSLENEIIELELAAFPLTLENTGGLSTNLMPYNLVSSANSRSMKARR